MTIIEITILHILLGCVDSVGNHVCDLLKELLSLLREHLLHLILLHHHWIHHHWVHHHWIHHHRVHHHRIHLLLLLLICKITSEIRSLSHFTGLAYWSTTYSRNNLLLTGGLLWYQCSCLSS